MAIVLSPETQRLIEQRMKETGFASADDLVRVALQALDGSNAEDFEALDANTQAAIEEGIAQADRGEGRDWKEVRTEILNRFSRT